MDAATPDVSPKPRAPEAPPPTPCSRFAPARALRIAARALFAGALPGALAYVGLFALCLLAHRTAEYMGMEDPAITDRIFALFDDQITAQQLGLLALYAAIGAAVGLFVHFLLELARAVRRRPFRWRRHLPLALLLVLAIHSAFVIASIAHYPAVYAPQTSQSLYLAALFAIAVDLLPSWLAAFLPFLFLLAALALGAILLARRPLSPRAALVLAAVGLVLGIAFAALRAPPDLRGIGSTDPARPNVVILAVDSLRADLLADTPSPIPNLAAFARRGTLFTRAIPTVPRTYPSWASMLTGQYPHDHGIRHMFPLPPKGRAFAHGVPELLGAAGYRTAVFSDFAGDVFGRADFGFQTVGTPTFTLASNVALGGLKIHPHLFPYMIDVFGGRTHPELAAFERLAESAWPARDALAWLADPTGAPDQPFALVVFFSAGHFPFAAPAPHGQAFVDPDYTGRSRYLKESFGQVLDGPEFDAERRHIKQLYQGAVSASDAAIGEVLGTLERQGLLANTLVILTADHGENLYEDELGMGHGDHFYGRETLEVPLAIDYPGNEARGQRFDFPVTLADIGPTVFARTGVRSTAPPETIAGIDLATIAAHPDTYKARPIFSEIDLWFFPPETRRLDGKRIVVSEGFGGFTFDPKSWQIYLDAKYQPASVMAKHRMLLAGDRKLLYLPTREGVRFELTNPLADPGDWHDLSAAEPERLAAMRAELYAWMLRDPNSERLGAFVVPKPFARAAPSGETKAGTP